MGAFGPRQVKEVPDDRSLEAGAYEKRPLAEALSGVFDKEEADAFSAMSRADSQDALNAAIARFNDASTDKASSELGLSLEDMLIEEQPLTLANGSCVLVSRSRRGTTTFRNPAS
jgi:hypothetical protein